MTGIPRTTWTSEPPLHHETKPVGLPPVSPSWTIRELISHLKSTFHGRDFSRIEEILTNREAQLRTEIQNLKRERDSADKHLTQVLLEKFKMEQQSIELKKEMEELKAEKAEADANSKAVELKYEELVSRVFKLEGKIAKKLDVDVSVFQKMAEDLEEEDGDVVKASSNGNGNSGEKGFVSAEKNLANHHGDERLHSMSSTVCSAQLNRSVFNTEETSCHSEEADPLPANLASENRAHIDLSVCKANTLSRRPGSSKAVHMIGSDDEVRGSNLAFPRKIRKEDIIEPSASSTKRKRSLSETDNGDGSSLGTQMTRSTQELDHDENNSMPPEPKAAFVRRSDVKVEEKWNSRLSLRKYNLVEIPDESSDSDDDLTSDKNMELLFKKFEDGRSILSEDDLRLSFKNNPELCMEGVCALYRQQIKGLKGLFSSENQVLITDDKYRIAAYAEYLIDGDAENKLGKAVADVSFKYQEEFKRLATKYCQQLHQIYVSKEDHLFCPGAIISS